MRVHLINVTLVWLVFLSFFNIFSFFLGAGSLDRGIAKIESFPCMANFEKVFEIAFYFR
jgi:hypothetical protein